MMISLMSQTGGRHLHLGDTETPRPPETQMSFSFLVVEVSLIAVLCFAGQPNPKCDMFTMALLITNFTYCQRVVVLVRPFNMAT